MRTEYGDLVVMMEVAAFMITMNFFAWSDTSDAGEGVRRQDEAGEDVHAVPHDQLLRQPLGDVRRGRRRCPCG